MTTCSDLGSSCINEDDSPTGPGSTTCRQLYRNQKLLAIDEKGEVEVDTFQLPSACVCNYKEMDSLR